VQSSSPNSADHSPIQPGAEFRTPHLVILILLGLIAWQTVHYYPLLPPTVASHFDGAGRPNRFQSCEFFFGMMWSVILLLLFGFLGVPRLLAHINPRLLNIPNREYWLTPERIGDAMTILQAEMSWFGVFVIGFLLFTMQLALQANMDRAPLDSRLMFSGLGVFAAFTIFWIVRLYRKMAIPK